MNREDFDNLNTGDIIRHVDGSAGYTVHQNYLDGGVLVVRSLLAHNPAEWVLVGKAQYTKGETMGQRESVEAMVEITVELPVHVYQRIQAEVTHDTHGYLTPDQWIAGLVREQFSYSEMVEPGEDE